jgi:N-methylhydantoinase B
MGFRPHGTDRLVGAMLGMRRWLPLEGAAGGMPGACTRFLIRRADGSVDEVATHASGVTIEPGDTFEFHCANGGGFGDPLDRAPASVHEDILLGRLTRAEAEETYGLRFDAPGQPDSAASSARRAEMLADRLARATPARTGVAPTAATPSPSPSGTTPRLPLYLGVVNEGGTAIAEESGAVLARSPAHWTDGCPVLIDVRPEGGPEVHVRSYLDPSTGKILYAEVALAGEARGFDSSPLHWTEAAGRT